jgi:hypothetical protein
MTDDHHETTPVRKHGPKRAATHAHDAGLQVALTVFIPTLLSVLAAAYGRRGAVAGVLPPR